MKLKIQEVISEMMDRVINKVLFEDPFIKDKHRSEKPLYAALVPDEIFKGSHFERRFTTPFGKAWEKLAVVAATEGLGYGVSEYTIEGTVKAEQLRRISEVLNALEHKKRKNGKRIVPDWKGELSYIREGKGRKVPVTVICDVFAENKNTGDKYAFELKAPLPNSDQTKVSKEKLFKLYCMEPPQIKEAFYALPYNPYGKREDYNWSFPKRWFNMIEDPVVLIGDEFWDKIGGIGTYRIFIDAVKEIGISYKKIIYSDYLGINPPEDAFSQKI